jgi:hypothetical protein
MLVLPVCIPDDGRLLHRGILLLYFPQSPWRTSLHRDSECDGERSNGLQTRRLQRRIFIQVLCWPKPELLDHVNIAEIGFTCTDFA